MRNAILGNNLKCFELINSRENWGEFIRNTHNTAIAKEEQKVDEQAKNDIAQGWQLLLSLISPWKRKGKKKKKIKLLQQGVFVFGHPSKYCLRQTGLNFVEQTKHVAVLVVYWLHCELKFLKWAKVSKREKKIWYCMAGKVKSKK